MDDAKKDTLDVSRMVEGARLVVVGGTGFLGKVFWAMLLDRYPEVGQHRARRAPEERADARGALLERRRHERGARPLRDRQGDGFEAFLREKVQPIDGDMGGPLCGLDAALVGELRGTIDAVVNVAGVVDFNPPLDEALDVNAFGAQNLVALARALGDAPRHAHEHVLRRRLPQGASSRGATRATHAVPARRASSARELLGSGARDRRVPRPHRAGARTAARTRSARASSSSARARTCSRRGEPRARRAARARSSRR